MKLRKKEIIVYVADDGTEFTSEKECKFHEAYLKLNKLHENLIQCDFHGRFKIVPYQHNFEVKYISPIRSSSLYKGEKYISYPIVYGRMGNGDCRVRYKLRGGTIVILRYNTDSDEKSKYLGNIPSKWIDLPLEELRIEVDKYISERKVFVRKITNTQTVTYEEI